ncbi:uncharacterized protein MONBRDRAFT_5896 [Monosiga brevicollis MX1]|uniref:Phosphate transporter n=1 Tax=Monosiga brevicollis TaxID=81824 RepID=A9UST2_MONBE|nr:uncharacterized protein MONBRDRAFT_5896 [Monosiga brevicollis MX1]EDQ92157.1 predicted protein [Monosiga brevicollis MX1]|eukprot:XP_001743443.1 hypothetical protein [Monosiga brevicollis MX1]
MAVEDTLLALSSLVAFAMLWAAGANDVANALGTSVGSKALTFQRAIVVGAIFELLGASLVGGGVESTIESDIISVNDFGSPRRFAIGMFAAIAATFLWVTVATIAALPVSTTHAIIGSVIGFAIAEGRGRFLQGQNIGLTAASWIVSPLLGGLIAFGIYLMLKHLVLKPTSRLRRAELSLPYLFALNLATDAVFVVAGGPDLLRPRTDSPEQALGQIYVPIFVGTFVVAGLAGRFWLLGWIRRHRHDNDEELLLPLSAPDGGRTTIASRQQQHTGDATNSYGPCEAYFAPLTVASACTVAFAHGGNDVANALGPLSVVINFWRNHLDSHLSLPFWVNFLGGVAIVAGLTTYGQRVMETVGSGITRLSFSKAFAAQFGASVSILTATVLGLPISTTAVLRRPWARCH